MNKNNIFCTTSTLKPPKPKKQPQQIEQMGRTRTENYGWLKDENWQAVMSDPSVLSSEIKSHLESENAYCAQLLAPTQALQEQIFAEFKSRIKDDESSVPEKDGPFAYSHRFRSGDEHGIYVRTPYKKPDEETILLDADALAREYRDQGERFFDLASVLHSDDHNLLAYALDTKGSEKYQIHIKSLDSGDRVGPTIRNTTGDVLWAKDNKTLFWVERDDNNRPSKVYRQDIYADAPAVLVYEENDPGFFVSIERSDTGNWINIVCNDHTTSEIWLIAADTPEATPQCLRPRERDLQYSLSDTLEGLFVLTNMNGAVDFKIMSCPLPIDQKESWQDLVPHRDGRLILGIANYQDYLVRLERENALPRIVIRHIPSKEEHEIRFDESVYALGLQGGLEFNTPWLRFSYSSPTTPKQVFDYHMGTRERKLLKTQEVPCGHNPKNFTAKRVEITARDGAKIPVTLLSRADFIPDRSAPCLLYGYGSYGITIPAGFRTTVLSLVERGFVYAIAHIRGSKAKGYQWYLDGKLEKKTNTFNDYIDVARGLVDDGYTNTGKIVAHGGSAGGLLVGAALNQAPELFAGAIAAVPFVDVLNTMSDESLPLTPPEWPEWGNPIRDKSAYDIINRYCPYQNTKDQAYPPVLATAGLTDPRVTYWEPAKWVAKLRDHQTGPCAILLKTHMDAGHQGESGRYASLKDLALEYAFAVEAVKSSS